MTVTIDTDAVFVAVDDDGWALYERGRHRAYLNSWRIPMWLGKFLALRIAKGWTR